VTCESFYLPGTTLTFTAKAGPMSVLDSWQGAAAKCNEPDGPGSPPATTCTVTVQAAAPLNVNEVIARFRPAST
jgi:hypothetical protein